MYINLVQSKNYHEKIMKTRTKVVNQKVSQGFHKSKRKKVTQAHQRKKDGLI